MPQWITCSLFVLVLVACAPSPPTPPADTGVDIPTIQDVGTADAGGARGLIRWGTAACNAPFDGGAPPGACSPLTTHTSNTGTLGPSPERLRCSARFQRDSNTVLFGFAAGETDDLTMPGSVRLRGPMGTPATRTTRIGEAVADCEITLIEQGHVATGRCGRDCTVIPTAVLADGRTFTGTIVCAGMPDDSSPTVYRTLSSADGVRT